MKQALLKRDAELFKRGLLPALFFSVLLALLLGLIAFSLSRGAGNEPPIQVAVVDEEGGLISRFAINLVSNQDYIASLAQMDRVSADKAREGFESGLFQAIIYLPDGYTDAIRHGNSGEAKIVLSRSVAAARDLVTVLADFGERLLAAGQHGFFTGESLARAQGLSDEAYQRYVNESNRLLLDLAVNLHDKGTLDTLTAYSGTGLGTAAWWALIWLSFFFLICGLFFIQLYTEDNRRALLGRLFSLGMGVTDYTRGKILFPFLFRIPLLALALGGLSFLLPLKLTLLSLILALAGLLLSSALIALTAIALASRRGWPGLVLGLLILNLFLLGGLLPRALLPQSLAALGDYLPLGALSEYFRALLGGAVRPWQLLPAPLYTGALALGAALHCKNMPQGGNES